VINGIRCLFSPVFFHNPISLLMCAVFVYTLMLVRDTLLVAQLVEALR